ncbi:hypothetical protein N8093_01290, partial [Planktomarina temperata]|nr:hypothetical protein [Planktomarina temperata]
IGSGCACNLMRVLIRLTAPPRCIYENDDIIVAHNITDFPNGTTDAVMMVHLKKDGLIWRTETGSTPLSK